MLETDECHIQGGDELHTAIVGFLNYYNTIF
jgi:hypothetical protein